MLTGAFGAAGVGTDAAVAGTVAVVGSPTGKLTGYVTGGVVNHPSSEPHCARLSNAPEGIAAVAGVGPQILLERLPFVTLKSAMSWSWKLAKVQVENAPAMPPTSAAMMPRIPAPMRAPSVFGKPGVVPRGAAAVVVVDAVAGMVGRGEDATVVCWATAGGGAGALPSPRALVSASHIPAVPSGGPPAAAWGEGGLNW